MKTRRTDEQNAEDAKRIRREVTATLLTLVEQLDAAKEQGYAVSFNIQVDAASGRHYLVGATQIARQY